MDGISHGISSPPLARLTGWEFSGSGEIEPRPSNAQESGSKQPAQVKPTPRVNVSSKESFDEIVRKGSPVVIEGLDLGACHSKWTMTFLAEQVGDRKVCGDARQQQKKTIKANPACAQVVVHACDVRNMDFNAKNFRYTTMTFADFANEIQNGARLYLRALSADAPANQPANLAHDFPSLADDFRLPEALNTCVENIHSSVLRISGQVSLPNSCPHSVKDVATPVSPPFGLFRLPFPLLRLRNL